MTRDERERSPDSVKRFNRSLSANRVMIAEPLLNLFFLSRQHDALPLYDARTLTVLRHDVRALIQYFDQAVRLCPFEVVRRERRMVFMHLT